jgi:predicted kinase
LKYLPLEIIVLTGLPGSGKSTLAMQRFSHYQRINLDTLKTRARESKEISSALENQESIIIDNTNLTIKGRKRYIDIGKAHKVPIRSIYLKCPVEIALEQNRLRTGKEHVPEFVIKMYHKKLEAPTNSEGFDSCEVVEVDEFQSKKNSKNTLQEHNCI